ncbi:MAG: NAD(P)H-dependent oxidoreductase [Rhizobiaceae bacterium]|nr:NAD(P)H-dependent oxidoreductase [Rhizobiaceae bacterium]
MARRILVIIGHPDSDPMRLCRVLADAYEQGARTSGHEVRRIDIARNDFPFLRSAGEFSQPPTNPGIQSAIEAIHNAEHIVFFFPLWLGTMPALLKAFLEQVMRPGGAFAYPEDGNKTIAGGLLGGRSARMVVTMGMPALIYRFWYLAHGTAGMRRNILNFVGIRPVRQTFFGMVEAAGDARRRKWIDSMRRLGREGR